MVVGDGRLIGGRGSGGREIGTVGVAADVGVGITSGGDARKLGLAATLVAAAGWFGLVGQQRVGDALAAFGSQTLLDQAEVVDPGRWARRGGHLGLGGRVDVAADHRRGGRSHGAALVADLNPGQVEGVEDQLDAGADQGGSTP